MTQCTNQFQTSNQLRCVKIGLRAGVPYLKTRFLRKMLELHSIIFNTKAVAKMIIVVGALWMNQTVFMLI